MYSDVVLNKYGFYTLKELPTDEAREAFYKEQYYQNDSAAYTTQYTDAELNFFKAKLEQKLLLVNQHRPSTDKGSLSFIDIGCGEGFAVSFFKRNGFSVLGLDYSEAGIKNHNADVLADVIIGDVYKTLEDLIGRSLHYDVINLDNVLEHVTNPGLLLARVARLMDENSILFIDVPNDFSILQQYFFDQKIISKPHWVSPLEHISYFNKDGLINLCSSVGLGKIDLLGNFMTEFFILNPTTNYMENPAVGKLCHLARVAQENLLHGISPQKAIDLYRALGEMGLGREIIGVFKKKVS